MKLEFLNEIKIIKYCLLKRTLEDSVYFDKNFLGAIRISITRLHCVNYFHFMKSPTNETNSTS